MVWHDRLASAKPPDLMRANCPDLLCTDASKLLYQLAIGYRLHTTILAALDRLV